MPSPETNIDPELAPILRTLVSHGRGAAMQQINDQFRLPALRHRADADRLDAQADSAALVVEILSGEESAKDDTAMRGGNSSGQGWREVVLQAAHAVADKNSNRVRVEHVIDFLEAHKVELPGSRPNTSIGNILIRDTNFKRLGESLYTRVRASAQAEQLPAPPRNSLMDIARGMIEVKQKD